MDTFKEIAAAEKVGNACARFWDSTFCAWLRVAAWCGLIFFMSSRPDYSGLHLDLDSPSGLARFAAHKTAHLAVYGILMVLSYQALLRSPRRFPSWRFLIAFLLVLLYVGTDEWHQTFVHGRNGNLVDVFIDSVGSLLGYCCYLIRS